MKFRGLVFFTILLCWRAGAVHAQTTKTVYVTVPESESVLPPLVNLIDSAIKHNALVKFRQEEIAAKQCNLKSQQNYWTRNLGLQADSRYGTFDNYSSNANGQSSTIMSSTSRQMNYGAGVFMKFPILDMIDRKNQLRRAKIELSQASHMAENQQDEVRQLVIRQYQEVLLKQRLLKIRAEALGNARVNGEMVEKQFRNGVIQVAEYVRISDIVARVESDFEVARSEFATAKMILEDIVGFTFPVYSIASNENN